MYMEVCGNGYSQNIVTTSLFMTLDQPYSYGLRHQVSEQDILKFCGSIPSLAIFFFHKINFSLIIFLSFNFEKYFFIVS